MASMILGYQGKTDSPRIAESVKWFEDIEDHYPHQESWLLHAQLVRTSVIS